MTSKEAFDAFLDALACGDYERMRRAMQRMAKDAQ